MVSHSAILKMWFHRVCLFLNTRFGDFRTITLVLLCRSFVIFVQLAFLVDWKNQNNIDITVIKFRIADAINTVLVSEQ